MKKGIVIVTSTFLAASILTVSPASSSASKKESNRIPDQMLAGTIIEYDQSNQLKIIVPGNPIAEKKTTATSKKQLSPEEQIKLQEEERLIQEINELVKDLPVYRIENPEPEPGMQVIYDGEGFINKIIYPKSETFDIAPLAYSALPRGTRKAPGTYTYGNDNNSIKITGTTSGQVLGVGRFTNFTDTIGESDNTLKKGDAATRGDIDNPAFGTELDARNLDNDVFAKVFKRDNGALPNAVLDIWKTGVELFDLTWSSSLSFNGRYWYAF